MIPVFLTLWIGLKNVVFYVFITMQNVVCFLLVINTNISINELFPHHFSPTQRSPRMSLILGALP